MPHKADVLIVTVTKVESCAVMQIFKQVTGSEPRPESIDGRVYFNLDKVNGARVFMTQSEMGSGGLGSSLLTVSKGIDTLSPLAVIMCGIAFGIDEEKQAIGEILVGEQLRLYELQRMGTQDREPQIVLRGDKPHASSWLINHFKSTDLQWSGAKVRFGVVMTGEKLVDNFDFREQLRSFEPETIGGEMEGAGLYVACQDRKVDWILVKAICDWGDGNKGQDKDARQLTAAQNAAAFVLNALQFTHIDWEERRGNDVKSMPNSDAPTVKTIEQSEKYYINRTETENPKKQDEPTKKGSTARISTEISSNSKIDRVKDFVLHKKDVKTFTGRTKELEKLELQLLNISEEKAGNIIGISGNGGWGKSTLASRFASLHKDKFDGVIGLPVDGKAVPEVARIFARLGGREIEEDEDFSPATIMQEVFAHRRMLLIFDNVDNSNLKVLQPGGLCSLIITTRDRYIHGSFGIPTDGIIHLSEFPDDDARDLLGEIVGSRVNNEPEAVDRIIEMTGSLPLALEIISYALQQQSKLRLSTYADDLKKEEDRLSELEHGNDIDLNVKASLNLSLKFLEDSDIDLFACLSVCAKNGFSQETAMQSGGLLSHRESRNQLKKLHRFSLLNEVSEERYVFHTLVQLYAQNIAQERNLWDAAAERHAKYFLDLVQSNNVESPEIANQIAEDFEDILQAAQWLRENAISDDLKESAYQFALDLRPFLLKYSYSEQAVELMTGFQSWAEDLLDWYTSVRFKIQQAKYLALLEQFSEAEVVLINSLDSIERISDPTQQQEAKAKRLSSLGGILVETKRFEEAIDAFRQQIEIEKIINDQRSLAITLNRLGGLLWQKQNKFDEAIDAFKESIEISKSIDDQISLVISLKQLGRLFKDRGSIKEAIEALSDEIHIREKLGDKKQWAIALNRLGCIFQQQNNLNDAINIFNKEIDVDRNMDDQRQLIIGLNCRGKLLKQQQKFDEAIADFNEQIEIAKSLNDQKQVATGWGCLGEAYQNQGNLEKAIFAYENEINIEEDLDNRQQLIIAWNRLGRVFKDSDYLEEGIAAIKKSIEIAEKVDDKINWAIGLDCLGSILRKQGKLEEAAIVFKKEIFIAETISSLKQLSIGWNSLGEISKQQGSLEESIFAFLHAATYNEIIKDKQQLYSIWKRLGDILKNSDNWKVANTALKQLKYITKDLENFLQMSIMLHVIGKAYSIINELEEANIVLQESRELIYELNNNEQLLEILKTLGEVSEQNQNFIQAEKIIRESYDVAEKISNVSIQEKILRKLGEICLKQETEEKLEDATNYFKQSIKLNRKMKDPIQLAQAYKAWGKALSNSGKTKQAVDVLIDGFEEIINYIEIQELRSGKYIGSLRNVTEELGKTLIKLRRREDALKYCDRASLATGSHDTFISLRNKLLMNPPTKQRTY